MRGLTLWQPWASAIAVGAKRVETRCWSTKYRGPIAIHSALKWTKGQKDTARDLCSEFASLPTDLADLPVLGSVVAIATLKDVVEMTERMVADCRRMYEDPLFGGRVDPEEPEDFLQSEFPLGDWRPGRFAWLLEDVAQLATAYPITGRQGLWKIKDQATVNSIKLLAGRLVA